MQIVVNQKNVVKNAKDHVQLCDKVKIKQTVSIHGSIFYPAVNNLSFFSGRLEIYVDTVKIKLLSIDFHDLSFYDSVIQIFYTCTCSQGLNLEENSS